MFVVIIILVAVSVAQATQPHPPYAPYSPTSQVQASSGFNNEGFLAGFSEQMEQLSRDMEHLQLDLAKIAPTEEITQKQYILTYQLPGFQKKDIDVEVKQGILIVKAIQKDGTKTNSHYNQRNLPEYVNPDGSWAFIGEILRIVFPLKTNYQQSNIYSNKGQNVGNTQGAGEAPAGNVNTGTKHVVEQVHN